MEGAMKPTIPLKLSAFAFAVLWSGWMVFLSGEPSTLVVTAICGAVAGWLWYRIMRWCFRRMRLLPNIGAGTSAAR
jgi:membrane associated rhomboid family serine protease